MESIKSVFIKFLSEQSERLKKRTFSDYESVIELFEHSLNSYGHNYLNKEDGELFKKSYKEGKEYCEIFEFDKVSFTDLQEFLDYFMIKKVMASKSLMKKTGTVMRKFINWLKENEYLDQKEYKHWMSTLDEIKDDLPKVAKLSDLIYEFSQNNQYNMEFTDYVSGYFEIIKVNTNNLWVVDYLEPDEKIGPVVVTPKISSLTKKGWVIHLELGKVQGGWLIVDSGSVYPY